MSGAIIVADQLTGAGLGSPGVARDDLWQAQAVTLSCATSGNISYQWDLLAAPPGSAVTLLTPSGATSGFTPDLVGTYRIRLTTNGGGPGNVQILVFRVRFSSTGALMNRGWAYPAFGELAAESNYGGNAIGWAEVFNTILEDIRINAFSGGGGGVTFGGDLSQPSVGNQQVISIQGLVTSPSSDAEEGNIPVVLPVPPWVGPQDIVFDGTNLWVADYGPTVFKTDAVTILGTYPLPDAVNHCNRIIFDGTHFYVGVAVASGLNYLYVLNSSGAIVGVGRFPSTDTSGNGAVGLALDGSGNVWTADNTFGLQSFHIATLLANGPSTPTSPSATYSTFTSCRDVCSDGTYLYATDSTGLVVKINPSGPTLVASATAPHPLNYLFFNASVGPNFYASMSFAQQTLVVITPSLSMSEAVSGAPFTSSMYRMATNGNGETIFAVLANNTVDTYNKGLGSSYVWQHNYAASAFSGGSGLGITGNTSGTVWACENDTFPGIQSFNVSGPIAAFQGPLGLTYQSDLLSLDLSSSYGSGTVWSLAVGNAAGSLFQSLLFTGESTDYFAMGFGWFDVIQGIATPSPPGTGWRMYVDSADSNLKIINPSSTVVDLSAASGGGISPPAGDIGGSSSSPTVRSIQGLTTSEGTSAASGDLAIVMSEPPWVGLADIAYDGTDLWVVDGGPAANGFVNVFKTDGTQILGQYPLPSSVSFCNRILFNGTYFFVGVGVSTGTHYLYVLNTSGAVVGVGNASSQDTTDQGALGLAFDGNGNVWTADQTNGLQCYSIATLISNGASTPTSPHATYALSSCKDVCFDGTYLYAINNSFGPSSLVVDQVNPATATLHASASAPAQIKALFFDSSLGTNIYGSSDYGNSCQLVIISPTLTFTTLVSSHSNYGLVPGRLATDGTGEIVYVSNSDNTVDVFLLSPDEWYANYAAPGFSGNANRFGIVHASGYNVWAVEGSPTSGIQEFTYSGAGASFTGPLTLTYQKSLTTLYIKPLSNPYAFWGISIGTASAPYQNALVFENLSSSTVVGSFNFTTGGFAIGPSPAKFGHIFEVQGSSAQQVALTAEATELFNYGTTSGNTQQLQFYDLTGASSVGFQAPDAVTTTTSWKLPPSDAGYPTTALTSDASGNLSFNNGAYLWQGMTQALSIPSGSGSYTTVTEWVATGSNSTDIGPGAPNFNTSTGIYTVPVTGIYEFYVQVEWAAASVPAGTLLEAAIFYGGNLVSRNEHVAETATAMYRTVTVQYLGSMTSGETVYVGVRQNSGASINIGTNAYPTTYLSAKLVK